MATINEVAQEANVSISTVSRVINNSFVVTEEKRRSVLAAMKKVGYQPAQRTRNSTSSSNKIILVISSLLIQDLFIEIQNVANDMGYNVLFNYIGDSNTGYANSFDLLQLLNDKVCGIILVNTIFKIKEIHTYFERFPVIQVGEAYQSNPCYIVSTDDIHAAYDLTNLLIRKGKNRIAFMTIERPEESKMEFSDNRLKGYKQALIEHNLPICEDLIAYTDFSIEGGIEGTKKLLQLPKRPDAIFCLSDSMAVGCIKALKSEGINIPNEISVAGFDNLVIASVCSPELTTVAQSFTEIGAEAVRMLDMLINGVMTQGRRIFINYEIIEREST